MKALEKKAIYKYNIREYKLYKNKSIDSVPLRLDYHMYLDSIRLTL